MKRKMTEEKPIKTWPKSKLEYPPLENNISMELERTSSDDVTLRIHQEN